VGGRVGREGKLIMEWEFINSVTIQLAKIVFQNFLCEEIKMKNAKYDDILNKNLIYKIEFITQQYIFIDG
jgi:hypothetical protein